MCHDEEKDKRSATYAGGKAADLWISGDMYPQEMDPTLRKSHKSSETDVTKNS